MDSEADATTVAEPRKRPERKKANILFVTPDDVEQLEEVKELSEFEFDYDKHLAASQSTNEASYNNRKNAGAFDSVQTYQSDYAPFKKRRGRKKKRKFTKEHPCCDDSEDEDDMGLEAEIDDDEYIRRLEEAKERELAEMAASQTKLAKDGMYEDDDFDIDYDEECFGKTVQKSDADAGDSFDSDYDIEANNRNAAFQSQEYWQRTLEQEIADVMDDSEKPDLPLPPSSTDLRCPNQYILPSIGVYEVLRRYGRLLRLSPFRLEDFLACLSAYENSTLLSEIHMSLLKVLIKEDDANNTLLCHTDQRDGVNMSFYVMDKETWPELLHWYLACTSNEHTLAIQLDSCYPFVHMEKRLAVLQCLVDMFLTSSALRGEIVKEALTRHEDFCRICHASGEVLCCDECTGVYHLACLDPPLVEAPETRWSCPVCVREITVGVTDCRSEQERTGLQHQHELLGKDRFGRKYWFIARRLIVEGRDPEPEAVLWHENRQFSNPNTVTYYSSWYKACQLLKALSPAWEADLIEHLLTIKDEMQRQMNLTVHLTVARWNQFKSANSTSPLTSKPPMILHEIVESQPATNDATTAVNGTSKNDSPTDTSTEPIPEIVFQCPPIPSNVGALLRDIETSISPSKYLDGNQKTSSETPSEERPMLHIINVEDIPQQERPDSPTGIFEDETLNKGFTSQGKELALITRNRDGSRLRVRISHDIRLSLSNHSSTEVKSTVHTSDWIEGDPMLSNDMLQNRLSHFCLGDECTWRKWKNLYTTDPMALSKQQHQEERERRRGLQTKFSLPALAGTPLEARHNQASASPGDFHWICGGPLQAIAEGRPFHILNMLRLTLAFIETQIPTALYCSAWPHVRPKWHETIYKARTGAELANALALLEACIKPICFHRAWNNSLGHLELDRTMAEEREEQKRLVLLERKLRQGSEIADNSVIRTRNPRLIRHTVWKTRGEEYRRLGGDGWMWLSCAFANPSQRAFNEKMRSLPLERQKVEDTVEAIGDSEDINPLTGKPFTSTNGLQSIENLDLSASLADPSRKNGLYAPFRRRPQPELGSRCGFLDSLLPHREKVDAELHENGFTVEKGEERLLELQRYKQRLLEKREKFSQMLEEIEERSDLPNLEELDTLFLATTPDDSECERILRNEAPFSHTKIVADADMMDEKCEYEDAPHKPNVLQEHLEKNHSSLSMDPELDILMDENNSLPMDILLPQMDGLNDMNFAVRSRPMSATPYPQMVARSAGTAIRSGIVTASNPLRPTMHPTIAFRQNTAVSNLGLGQPMMVKISSQSQAHQQQVPAIRPPTQVIQNVPRTPANRLPTPQLQRLLAPPSRPAVKVLHVVSAPGSGNSQRFTVVPHPGAQSSVPPSMTMGPVRARPFGQQVPCFNNVQHPPSAQKTVLIKKYSSANERPQSSEVSPVIQSVCSLVTGNLSSRLGAQSSLRPMSTRVGGSAGRKSIPGISMQPTPVHAPTSALAMRAQQSIARRQRVQEITAVIQKYVNSLDSQIDRVTKYMTRLEERLVLAEKTTADTFSLIIESKNVAVDKEDKKKAVKSPPCPEPTNFLTSNRENKMVFNLFHIPRAHLRQCILAAGRMELVGWDIERKRSTQIFWPYPSARPGFCVAWRYRLAHSADSLSSIALHMRIFYHSLRWEDIKEQVSNTDGFCPLPPGGGIRASEIVDEPVGDGGAAGGAGPQRRRLIVDMRNKDKYGLVCEFLVQLHSQGPTPSTATPAASGHGTRHSSRQTTNSIISSLMAKDSDEDEVVETPNAAALVGAADENAYASDDPDFDPRNSNTRTRGTRAAGSSRRSAAIAARQQMVSASATPANALSTKWHILKEEWVADFELQLWEIRTFIERSLFGDNRVRSTTSQGGQLAALPAATVQQENLMKTPLIRLSGLTAKTPLDAQVPRPAIAVVTPRNPPSSTRPPPSQRSGRAPSGVGNHMTPGNSDAARAKLSSQQHNRLTMNMERSAKQLEQNLLEKKRLLQMRAAIEVDAEITLQMKKEFDEKEADRKRRAEDAKLKRVHAKRSAEKRKLLMEEKKHAKRPKIKSEESLGSVVDDVVTDVPTRASSDDTDPCMVVLEKTSKQQGKKKAPFSPTSPESKKSSTKKSSELQSPEHGVAVNTPAATSRKRGRQSQKPVGEKDLVAVQPPATPNRPPPSAKKRGRPSRKQETNEVAKSSADELYCLCRTPYDPNVGYIGCDACDGWYHFNCVGVSLEDADRLENWRCPNCTTAEKKANSKAKVPKKEKDTHTTVNNKAISTKNTFGKNNAVAAEKTIIKREETTKSTSEEPLYCLCRTPYDMTKAYIACDTCDEWYHAGCVGLKDEEAISISGTYMCPRCKPVAEVDSSASSSKPPPTSFLTMREADMLVSEAVRRKLKKILSDLTNCPSAGPFLHSVDESRFPDYRTIVHSPIDFPTIGQNLRHGRYSTVGEFLEDVCRIWENCRAYFPADSHEVRCAEDLEVQLSHFMQDLAN